jgi:hypothetical protein
MDNLLARLEFTNPAIEAGLFHDTGILPAQFYPGHRDVASTEPIKKLMTAILVDAVQCYRAGQRQTVKGTEALEASVWIFGSYTEFPFSFTNVCTELGLSPGHIRLQLRDRDKQASAGGRPRMLRRPSIRTLRVQAEHRRSRRSSRLRSAESISGFRA